MAVISYEPAHEGKEELSERRVDIEEVGSLQILGIVSWVNGRDSGEGESVKGDRTFFRRGRKLSIIMGS